MKYIKQYGLDFPGAANTESVAAVKEQSHTEPVNLECISAFWDEVRMMSKPGKNAIQQLLQYKRELETAIRMKYLYGQGLKAAESLLSKLTKHYNKFKEVSELTI